MRLEAGGSVRLRAPERGELWCADLSVIAAEGERPSAAVYLTAKECRDLARWLLDMTRYHPGTDVVPTGTDRYRREGAGHGPDSDPDPVSCTVSVRCRGGVALMKSPGDSGAAFPPSVAGRPENAYLHNRDPGDEDDAA